MLPLTVDDLLPLDEYAGRRREFFDSHRRYLDRYRRVRIGPGHQRDAMEWDGVRHGSSSRECKTAAIVASGFAMVQCPETAAIPWGEFNVAFSVCDRLRGC